MIAPSITTPELTYFHSATSSLRASATIIGFFKRPPFCAIRFLNQQDSVEVGWCRNHSPASATMVALRRGFPAFDTPCSRLTLPLCQGEGQGLHTMRLGAAVLLSGEAQRSIRTGQLTHLRHGVARHLPATRRQAITSRVDLLNSREMKIAPGSKA